MSTESAQLRFRRVLVTGATGFIGGAVVRALLSEGHEVTGLVRSNTSTAARELEGAGVRLAVGDMLDPASYRDLPAVVDAVVHTAQYAVKKGRVTRAKVDELVRANSVITTALAEACKGLGKRFVFTSSTFTYGDRGDEWIDESTAFNPSPLGETHAKEVLALRAMHQASGLDLVVVAPGFVLGPGGYFKDALFDQVLKKRLRVIGSGRNYWSCIELEDLGPAFAAALERAPSGGEYNVVDDKPVTLRELVDTVTTGMGTKRVGTIPPFLMNLLIGGPLVESMVSSFRVSNRRARADLGWEPAFPTIQDAVPSILAGLHGG